MFFSSTLVALLAVTAQAFPAADPVEANSALIARQTIVSAELDIGPCRQITFIFARGSTEAGNMVNTFNLTASHDQTTNDSLLGCHRRPRYLQSNESTLRQHQRCLPRRRLSLRCEPHRKHVSSRHFARSHRRSDPALQTGKHKVSQHDRHNWRLLPRLRCNCCFSQRPPATSSSSGKPSRWCSALWIYSKPAERRAYSSLSYPENQSLLRKWR